MTSTTLSELKNGGVAKPAADTEIGFQTVAGFEALQRMAQIFAASPITPDTFREPYTARNYRGESETRGCDTQKQAIGACAIALDMALRMKANPLMVMQNLYVVHGRPAWSAKFLIATLNKSGKFSALKYVFQGQEGTDDWGCRAVATEIATGEVLSGPLITISLAKSEGWYDKKGSKWRTMPEVMLRYRAAAWFVSAYAPEIAMGLPEAEEVRDSIIDITPETGDVKTEDKDTTLSICEIEKKTRRGRKKTEPEQVNEQPVQDEPEQTQTPAGPTPEKSITCPKNGKNVTPDDCFYCDMRSGCPEME